MPNDAPMPFPPERIARTQQVFAKLRGREISAAEAIEIMTNVQAFVTTLMPLAAARIAERKSIQNSKPKVAGEENTLSAKNDNLNNTLAEPKTLNAVEPTPQPDKGMPL